MFVYLYVFVYVCVYVCTDTEFWILRAALNFGPLRDHFSDNLHSSFILSIWKGDPSGICTSCQRMILIKNVQASKTTKKRNNRRKKKKQIQNSYWQTTQWNIWRILKSLFSPTGSHYHLSYLGFPQPASKPPNLASHSTTTALL